MTVVTAGREGCVGKRDKRTELACPKLRLQICLPCTGQDAQPPQGTGLSPHLQPHIKKATSTAPLLQRTGLQSPCIPLGFIYNSPQVCLAPRKGEAAVPVVRDEELKLSDVGGILGEDDVTCELAWGKPEREARRFVQLELSVDSAMRKEPSAAVPGGENESRIADDSGQKSSPGTTNDEAKLGQRFSSKSFSGHTMKRIKDWSRSLGSGSSPMSMLFRTGW